MARPRKSASGAPQRNARHPADARPSASGSSRPRSGAGLSASEYARALVLAGRVVVRQNRTLDHAVFDELRRIGVNLNQLTRLAHQRQQFPAGLTEVFAALERILARELESGCRPPAADGGAGRRGRPVTARARVQHWSLKSPGRARASKARARIICTTRRPIPASGSPSPTPKTCRPTIPNWRCATWPTPPCTRMRSRRSPG